MSSPAAPAEPATALVPRRSRAVSVLRPTAGTWTGLGVAAVLTVVAFAANGGLRLGETTTVELGLLLGCGVGGAAAIMATPDRGRWWGAGALGLFALFAAWTVFSIGWAANPSDAWVEANRTVTYTVVFAAALALVRVAPRQWEAVLAGIVLAATIVSVYALATRVLPGELSPDELYARLRAPFGYWNATGLFAALGVPACLWLGARRHGWGPASALAYPALGLLLVTQLLAYSRGTLLALAIGLIFWFAVVPLRLRGTAVLLGGCLGAIPVALWAFSREGLTTDRLPVVLRDPAGHQLGVLLIVMAVLLLLVGLAVTFREARFPLSNAARRRVGTTLLIVLALAPVVFAGYLATTDRGLTGSVSHAWTTLTDPAASTPPNDPSRLTAIGSVRSRYWNEALKTFADHPWIGVGADGYATVRPFYRQDTLEVRHAHGFVVQTLADLGIVGLLLALAFVGGWAWSAMRATGLRARDRGEPFMAERIGLMTMVSIVIVFGVHSFVDWTWYVPACALVALLCAGWVAGRGPLREAMLARPPLRGPRAWLHEPVAMAGAAVTIVAALLLAWAVWQPLRSLNASNDALAALEAGDVPAALRLADTAHARNPLSLDPLSVRAVAQVAGGDVPGALATLQEETRLQPANPEVWTRLADFQLNRANDPQAALDSLQHAVYLDPRNEQTLGAYLVVLRATEGG